MQKKSIQILFILLYVSRATIAKEQSMKQQWGDMDDDDDLDFPPPPTLKQLVIVVGDNATKKKTEHKRRSWAKFGDAAGGSEGRLTIVSTEEIIFERSLLMGFIIEFVENLVLRLMDDPTEQDNKARERVYEHKEQCKKTIEMHRLPLRPYGFWTFERHNAQLFWDEQISNVPGRRGPYDDLIEDYSRPSK